MFGTNIQKTHLVLTPLIGDFSFVTWLTHDGSLGHFNVNSNIDIHLQAKSSDTSGIMFSMAGGSLPSGLTLDAYTGDIAGTTPSTVQTIPFVVRATNGSGEFSDQSFSISIVNDAPVWQTPSGSIGGAAAGDVFSTTVLATDPNNLPITYSLSGSLPTGLGLNAKTGLISGTLPASGQAETFSFSIVASDGVYSTPRSFSITAEETEGLLWISTGSLGTDVQNKFFYAQLLALTFNSNASAITYSLESGSLPTGLTLDSAEGVISGYLPSVTSDTLFPFVIGITDGVQSLTRQFSITSIVDNTGVDSFANSVVLLMHMDEINNMSSNVVQNFVDVMGHSVVADGQPVSYRDVHLFGNASAYFPGGGGLSVNGNSDFDFSSTDFTVEFDALVFESSATIPFMSLPNFDIYYDSTSNNLSVSYQNAVGSTIIENFTYSLPMDTWINFALVKSGNMLSAFADGSFIGTVNMSGGLKAPSAPIQIGIGSNAFNFYVGLLDEIRVTRAARYSSSYTLATRPFPNVPVITTTSLPDAISLTSYSATISAVQFDNHTLSYSASGLPTGLMINNNFGAISGTAPLVTVNTVYSPVFTVFDGYNTVSRVIQLTDERNAPPVWITPSGSLGSVVETSTVNIPLRASSQQSLPLSLSVLSGELPPGLGLNGLSITGTAPAESTSATFDFTLSLSDGVSSVARDFNLTVAHDVAPTWISNGIVYTGFENTEVRFNLRAFDPASTITYSIVSGSLPNGLTLQSNGYVYGTYPSVSMDTTYSFTAQATNLIGLASTQDLQVVDRTGADPTWITPPGSLGEFVAISNSINITLVGQSNIPGTAPSFSLVSGNLPTGLSLGQTGRIQGTANAVTTSQTTYDFTVSLANQYNSVNQDFSIIIDPDLAIHWVTSPTSFGAYAGETVGFTGATTNSIFFNAITFDQSTISYSLGGGSLPTGISLNSVTGVLYGTFAPESAVNSPTLFDFYITATSTNGTISNSNPCIGSVSSTIPIWELPYSNLGALYVGLNYNIIFEAISRAELTYSVTSGTLPSDFVFNSNGLMTVANLSNTDVSALSFTVTASDGVNSSDRAFTADILFAGSPEFITASHGITPATAVVPYSFQVEAIDPNNLPLTYSVSGGNLPTGLMIDPSTGVISGTPAPVTSNTATNFALTATNGAEATARSFSIEVIANDILTWVSNSILFTGISGNSVNYQLQVINGSPTAATFSVVSGSFPNTLSLSSSGDITGLLPIISSNNSYNFVVNAVNDFFTISRNFRISVVPAFPIWVTKPGSLGSMYASQYFTATLVANSPIGASDITFSVTTGALPSGLTLVNNNDNTATISGYLPDGFTSNQIYNFTVAATNSIVSVTQSFSITDLYSPFVWTIPSSLISRAQANSYFSFTGITASFPAFYTITKGSLPSGITLNSTTGEIYGTMPNDLSSVRYTFEVTATAVQSFPPIARSFDLVNYPASYLPYYDPYSDYIALQIQFNEGTAAGTNFIDELGNSILVGINGTPHASFSSNRAVFGSYSACFYGYETLYVSGAGIDLSTTDFALEFWNNFPTPISANNKMYLVSTYYFALYYQNNNLVLSTKNANYTCAWTPDNNWHHIALVKHSGDVTIYVDGGTTTYQDLGLLNDFQGGVQSNYNITFCGGPNDAKPRYFSQFRLTLAARYTAPFAVSDLPYVDLPAVMSPASLPFAYGGVSSVFQQFTASDPYISGTTFSVDYGSTLPSGLMLSSSGQLSGTPANPISNTVYNFGIAVTDGIPNTTHKNYSMLVQNYQAAAWTIASGSLGSILAGYPFTANPTAVSPQGRSITYSLVSGSLPPGFSLNHTTGQIRGTPSATTSTTTFSFTLGANDSITVSTQSYSITVTVNNPPIWNISAGSLGNAIATTLFSTTVSATDPENQTVTYSIASGALPTGITLNTTTGVISGTPTNPNASKTYNFTLAASNGYTYSTIALSIYLIYVAPPVVSPFPVIGYPVSYGHPGNFALVNGESFSYQINAIDPLGLPITFSLTPNYYGNSTYPPGIFMNSTGYVSGTMGSSYDGEGWAAHVIVSNGYANTIATMVFHAYIAQTPVFTTPVNDILGTYSIGATISSQILAHDVDGLPLTYSISNQPSGLDIVANSGLIIGTFPNISTDATYYITVTASNGYLSASRDFVTVEKHFSAPVWNTGAGSLGSTNALSGFSYTLSATSYSGQITFSVTSGTLPNGLTLSSNGIISGTVVDPVSAHTSTFAITIDDGYGGTVAETFSITVNAIPAPVWNYHQIGTGAVYNSSNQQVSSPFYTAYKNGIALPSNLTLASYATTADGLSLTFSTSTTLPDGVMFDSTGLFSGTLANDISTGLFPISVTVSNGFKSTTQTWYLNLDYVAPPNWISSGSLGNITGGVANTIVLQTTVVSGETVTYSLTNGTLPSGLSLSSSGVISGTPANPMTNTESDFTITAANPSQGQAQNLSITVDVNTPPVWQSSGLLATFSSNVTITPVQLVATSATNDALTYSVSSGSLPSGLSLSSIGVLSGRTPLLQSNATYNFVASVAETDGVNSPVTQNLSIVILEYAQPTFSTPAGSLGTVLGGRSFNYSITASDPHGLSLTYTITSGSLPAGLSMNGSGFISGTASNPSADTTYNFTVSASDGVAAATTSNFSIFVSYNAPPNFTSSGNFANVVGFQVVDIFANAVDANNQTITFSETGNIPPGLSISSSGEISGTVTNPSTSGTYYFNIIATNGVASSTLPASFYVTKYLAPTWNGVSSSFGSKLNGQAFDFISTATDPQGGSLTYTQASGTLPGGLVLNASSGEISGTLALVSNTTAYTFVISAVNAHLSTPQTFTISINPYNAPVWSTSAGSLGSVYGASVFSQTVVATDTNGIGLTISYSLVSGSFPSGITLNGSTGVISGTAQNPTSNTTSTFTIAASNGTVMTNRTFSITVNQTLAPIWNTSANLGTIYGTTTVSFPLSATDPRGLTITYSADPNNTSNGYTLPAGLVFNAANATIYGTLANPTTSGSFSFAVDATNGIATNALTFYANTIHVDAPAWQTANGSLGSAFGLSTCASVPLELNFDGNIVDNSGHFITTSPFGAVVSNSVYVAGSGSLGLTGGYISVNQNSNEFNLGKSDFTIEASVYFTTIANASQSYKSVIIEQWSLTNLGWGLAYVAPSGTSTGLQFFYSTDGSTSVVNNVSFTASTNTWYRIAVSKVGSSIYFFVNGVLTGTVSSFTPSIFASSAPVTIGYDAISGGNYVTGYLDEIRITTKLGRYSSTYSPLQLPFHSANITNLLAVDDNNLPVTYSIIGTLPTGISLNANTGVFSGSFANVSNTTTYNFSVNATNGYLTNAATFSMTVNPETAPVWYTTSGVIGNALGGYSITANVSATDADYPFVLYSLSSGTLPTGLILNAVTGVIVGITTNPVSNTISNVTVSVTDGYLTNTLNVAFTIVHNPPPYFTNVSANSVIGAFFGGVANSVTITAADQYNQSMTFSGSMPTGLSIASNGVISGTVAQPSTQVSNVAASVTVTNGFASNTISFYIQELQTSPPNWVSPAAGFLGNVGENIPGVILTTLNAVDPHGFPVTYNLAAGSLPNGLVLNSNGVVSGTIISAMNGFYTPDYTLANDPYSNTVVLLMEFDNGTTNDAIGHSVSMNGTYWAVSTATSMHGSGSLYLTGSNYFTVGLNPNWGIGSYTIDYSVNFTNIANGIEYTLLNQGIAGNGFGNYWGSNYSQNSSGVGTIALANLNANFTFSTGVWYTITFQYNATTTKSSIYINGVLLTSSTSNVGFPTTYNQYAPNIYFGTQQGGNTSNLFNGYVDEIRISLGVARYDVGGFVMPYLFGFTANATTGAIGNTRAFTFDVFGNSPPLWNTTTLVSGFSTENYSQALIAKDNTGINQTITYSLVSGTLPSGLTLSSNGVISGVVATVTNTVTSTFTVSASDYGGTTNKSFNLSVSPYVSPTWNTASGSLGTIIGGHAFTTTLGATDNESLGLTYAVTSGTLPPGLSLSNSSATISGNATNPVANTTYSFVVSAIDAYGSNTQSFTITVEQNTAPTFQNSGSLAQVYGNSVANVAVIAIDSNNQTITYAVSNSTTLPSNLVLNSSTGVISGTAANPVSNTVTNFVVSATNGYYTAYQNFSIEVDQTLPPVFTTSAGTIATYASNTVVNSAIVATDPRGLTIIYSIASGTFPAGLTFYSNGIFSGTTTNLTTTTTSTFTVQATNGIVAATRTFAIVVNAVPAPSFASSGSLGTVLGGHAFSNSVAATDPGYTVTYSVSAGSLPSGLSLSGSNGTITGTATNPSSVQNATAFSVTATNGYTNTVQAFSIQVVYDAPPFINTAAGTLGTIYGGAVVSNAIVAYDPTGFNQTLTFSTTSGSLPSGLTLSTAGLISGTATNPASNTTSNFTVQVTNGITSNSAAYSLTVNKTTAPTWVTSNALGTYYQTQVLSTNLVATDHNGMSLTYAVTSGTLPIGLALSTTGALTGTISNSAVVGLDTFTVTAADAVSNASQAFTMNVVAYSAPVWTTAAGIIESNTPNSVVNATVVATSLEGYPISYSVSSGTLPSTIFLSNTGTFTGNLPVTYGTYSVGVAAYDGVSSVSQTFSFVSAAVTPVWNTTSLPIAYGLTSYSTTLSATYSPIYSIVSGSLPAGLTLNGATGVISGTPSNVKGASSYVITFAATLGAGSANQTLTLVVSQNLTNYDPYSQYVCILMPMTGNSVVLSNAASNYQDVLGHPVSYTGTQPTILMTPTIYNGQQGAVSASMYPGNGSVIVTLNGPEFVFGSNDYTVEYSALGDQDQAILYLGPSGNPSGLYVNSGGATISAMPFDSTTSATILSNVTQISGGGFQNSWMAIAFVKKGNTFSLYLNGALKATATSTAIATLATPTQLGIQNTYASIVGIKNVRVTNGAARYNGNYTVPVTLPLLPSFTLPSNSLLGEVTNGIAMNSITVTANDPWGLGLTFTADLPTGLSMSSSGIITGTPIGYNADTVVSVTVTVQDAYFNVQTRSFFMTVVAQPVADLYAGNTVVLMHFDGTPNSNTAITETLGHVVTVAVGNPVLNAVSSLTNQDALGYPFGGSCLYLNGSSAVAVSPFGYEFNLGNNDFTIEARYMFFLYSGYQAIVSQRNSSYLGAGWTFGMNSYNNLQFGYSVDGTTLATNLSWPINFNLNKWYNVAVVRKGGNMTAYANGVLLAGTFACPAIYPNNGNLYIGYDNKSASNFFAGWIDEVRITNGSARYTASYTVPTTGFANPIYWATNAALSGITGTAVSYNLTPTEPYNASFSSISVSGLPSGLTATNGIVSGTLPTVFTDTTYSINVTATSVYSMGTKNYVLTNYATPNTDPYASNVTLFMNFNGTNNSNATNFLYNPAFNDLTGLSTPLIVGSPTISTTVTNNGAASVYYNGSSGIIMNSTSSAPLSLGTNDFTLETSIYFTVSPSVSILIIGAWTSTPVAYSYLLQYSSGTLQFYYGTTGSNVLTTNAVSWTPTLNTWYKFAVVRKNGTVYVFINGVLESTTTGVTASFYPTTSVTIGYQNTPAYITAYITNVRITNGFGRYTANYTPTEFPTPVEWITSNSTAITIVGGTTL